MKIPDVTGHSLKDAQILLHEAGVGQIEVLMTAPPRLKGQLPTDTSRVVRQKNEYNCYKTELVVCDPEC